MGKDIWVLTQREKHWHSQTWVMRWYKADLLVLSADVKVQEAIIVDYMAPLLKYSH